MAPPAAFARDGAFADVRLAGRVLRDVVPVDRLRAYDIRAVIEGLVDDANK